MTRKFVTMMVFALSASAPQFVFAHGDESRVAIEADSTAPMQAGAIHYKFELVDTENNQVLKESDLIVNNEMILHFIVYDPALQEFQHVHPIFDGHFWVVDLSFAKDGNYWLWTQGKLKIDGEEFSSSTRLQIYGGQAEWPAPPVLTDTRINNDGNSTATLSGQRLIANKMAMLSLTLGRNDGTQPDNSPYLGAFAHVIAVPEDADSLLHVHPMSGSVPSQGMLHITFPAAGFYRIWVQFMDSGVLKTTPLSVQVF